MGSDAKHAHTPKLREEPAHASASAPHDQFRSPPKKKKPSSGPRVPFLPASDHKLTQLFEDLVWQVEQGVHRIEFLERELRLERATRETAKSTEEDRVERVKRYAAAMAATHSFLDDERRAFAEERTRLEDCIRANLAAFHALQHDDVPSLIDRPPPP